MIKAIIMIMFALLVLSCVSDPEPNDGLTAEPRKQVIYRTSAHSMDVLYCDAGGVIKGLFDVYKFTDTVYLAAGENACLSGKKIHENNNIYARIYIEVDSVIYKESGLMNASLTVEIE